MEFTQNHRLDNVIRMKMRLCFVFSLALTATATAEMRTWTLEAKSDLAPLATKNQVRVKGDDGKMVTVWRTNLQYQGELVGLATNKIAIVRQVDGKTNRSVVPLGWTNLDSGSEIAGSAENRIRIAVRGDDGLMHEIYAPLTTTNVPHDGKLVGFFTNRMAIIRRPEGELFQQLVTDLVAGDQAYIARIEAALPRLRFDQEVKDFEKKGYVQITNKATIYLLPHIVAGNHCWMDADFFAINPAGAGEQGADLGFCVLDKDGVPFDQCRVPRDHKKDVEVLKLQRGDKVRLIGMVLLLPVDIDAQGVMKFDATQAEFRIERVEMIPPPIQKVP
jgi:hypothetical protein